MSHVHYKFQSNNEHDSIVFDGLGISLAELRSSILAKSKLAQSADFNIQITNAQTKEGEFNWSFNLWYFLHEILEVCLFGRY